MSANSDHARESSDASRTSSGEGRTPVYRSNCGGPEGDHLGAGDDPLAGGAGGDDERDHPPASPSVLSGQDEIGA